MLDFLKKTNEKSDVFWALLIEPEWITAAIWQIKEGKVEILSTSPATRWEPTEGEPGSDLIEPIDASLSSCTQNLPDDIPDPSKTVFGVPNAWIDGGNIKEEYLEKLKKICTDLSLVPSGFVVLSEAISHFIKQDEESALTGIVMGVNSDSLDISIFELGKLIGTTSVFRSVTIIEDITEGLSRLGGDLESFPSRIILFNQKEQELEEIKNSLSDADWSKVGASKFIHTPKIEVLEPSQKILAVALAGGSELGDVSGVVGAAEADTEDEVDTKTEELPLEEVANIEEPSEVTAADLGFVVNGNAIAEEAVSPKVRNLPKLNLPKLALPALSKFNFKKPNIKLNFGRGSKPLIMLGVLLGTLFVVGFVLWWTVPTASITISVTPKKLEENIVLSLDDNLKREVVESEVSDEKTISTTGTKTVGEKAKGSVKIQNGTAFPINVASGTVLVSSGDLRFLTTKTASVSGALSPSSPGTATVDVIAENIGSEFNLSKDEVFKVGNYPKAEVDGTSVDTFTGGSSKQISSVSETDSKKLMDELKKELVEQAKTELNEKMLDDMILIDSSLVEEITEEDYSNKVGDEATNLKLSLTLKITASTVSKTDLFEISKSSLESKIPSGFVLRGDQVNYDFEKPSEEDTIDARVSVNLLPSIDTTAIAKQIAGKYPKIAEDFLTSVPGFVNAEIRINPTLNGKLGTLPHLYKKIEITILAEQ